MTDFRHEGLTPQKLAKAIIGELNKHIPNWHMLALLDLVRGAARHLQHFIAEGTNGISWACPWVVLEYPLSPEGGAALAQASANMTADEADVFARDFLGKFLRYAEERVLLAITKNVILFRDSPPDQQPQRFRVQMPPELRAEVDALEETERGKKINELCEGFALPPLQIRGTVPTAAGPQAFACGLVFIVRPLVADSRGENARFRIQVGLDFKKGDRIAWPETYRRAIWARIFKTFDKAAAPFMTKGKPQATPVEPSRVEAGRDPSFAVAGAFVRPIYALSKAKEDLPLLREWHDPRTPLNWAVGFALFSLTDPDRIRRGEMQEASIKDIADAVFCLTEREASIRGDHRTDILAEIIKLHTARTYYFFVEAVRVGKIWKKRAELGSQYPLPELVLVFRDRKTGKRGTPTDALLQAMAIPLEVNGRRASKDGKDLKALPSDRWVLDAVRWRWLPAFCDDLLIAPDLIEDGPRKGLPKKTASGKVIRKGYLIPFTRTIFTAMRTLRAEGQHSFYACRLLVMLAGNLHKTEDGIAADRVFRMLGIPEGKQKEREDIVSAAVRRLKALDIGALLDGSDEEPRHDPNPDRRRGPYYRFFRAPDFTPSFGIAADKAEADAIAAEYAPEPDAAPSSPPSTIMQTAYLPGLEADPLPTGGELRAAREHAGMTLRAFAKLVGDGSHNTWAKYERGDQTLPWRIKEDAWKRVRAFVASHQPPAAGRSS